MDVMNAMNSTVMSVRNSNEMIFDKGIADPETQPSRYTGIVFVTRRDMSIYSSISGVLASDDIWSVGTESDERAEVKGVVCVALYGRGSLALVVFNDEGEGATKS
jgi:hypothetical protein